MSLQTSPQIGPQINPQISLPIEVAAEGHSSNVPLDGAGVNEDLRVNTTADCASQLHKYSLLFYQREVEDAFVVNRASLLLQNSRNCSAIAFIIIGIQIALDPFHTNPYDESLPKETTAVRQFCFSWVWGAMVLAGVFFIISPRVWSLKTTRLRGEWIGEYLCTFIAVIGVWFPICWSYKHSAWLHGKDTNEVWGNQILTDHKLELLSLLHLFIVVAICNVFIPIRTCLFWIVELSAIAAYAVGFCHNPEVADVAHTVYFGVLCLTLFTGHWRAEKRERSDYSRILQEKRLRFNAEHALASTVNPVPREGSEPHSELPESFFLYSADGSSTQAAHVHVQRETQTDLSWTLDGGFKCQRCSRPPKPERMRSEDEREKVWVAVQKYGKPSKISRLQLEHGAIGSESSSSEAGSARSSPRNQQTSHQASSRSGRSRSSHRASGQPHASAFSLTPDRTKLFMIRDVLLRWNCSRGGPIDCCPFHVALRDAIQAVHRLQKKPCNPLWMPVVGGQCGTCGAMSEEKDPNEECDEPCEFCGGVVNSVVNSEPSASEVKADDEMSTKHEDNHPSVSAHIHPAITARTTQL